MLSWAEAIDSLAEQSGFAGVVSVDRGGEVEFGKAYGLADRAHQVPNTIDTRFALASGTKGLTALTVVSLISDGALGLATAARSALGQDLPLIGEDVTVEHLLAHRSGIGDYLDEKAGYEVTDYVLTVPAQDLADTERYLAVLGGHPAKFPAGERFSYCNGGYVVLALIAERVSGVPFPRLVHERVCAPAGMRDTAFLRSDELPGRTARLPAHRGQVEGERVPPAGRGQRGWRDLLHRGRHHRPLAVAVHRPDRACPMGRRNGAAPQRRPRGVDALRPRLLQGRGHSRRRRAAARTIRETGGPQRPARCSTASWTNTCTARSCRSAARTRPAGGTVPWRATSASVPAGGAIASRGVRRRRARDAGDRAFSSKRCRVDRRPRRRDGRAARRQRHAYLRHLLQRPGVDVKAADLAAAVAGHPGAAVSHSDADVIDAQALSAYRARLADIDAELSEAESWADGPRASRLRLEREALLGEIGAATGLGGRRRRFTSAQERARVAVRKAIVSALDRIDQHDSSLARRLRDSVRTGSACRYDPDPVRPVVWILDG